MEAGLQLFSLACGWFLFHLCGMEGSVSGVPVVFAACLIWGFDPNLRWQSELCCDTQFRIPSRSCVTLLVSSAAGGSPHERPMDALGCVPQQPAWWEPSSVAPLSELPADVWVFHGTECLKNGSVY